MYQKTEQNIEKSRSFVEPEAGERPSTPVFEDRVEKTPDSSPFLAKAPAGYDKIYHLTKGKDISIVAYSPDGGKIVRRKHEGQAHPRVKIQNRTYTGSPRKKPEHEVHAIVTELVGIKRRFETDCSFIKSRSVIEASHFHYAKKELENVLDRILKVYLACESRADRECYLASLNRHIVAKDFFNPFQLKSLYNGGEEGRFSHEPSLSEVEQAISERDIKSILIDQLFRLKQEADTDYCFFVKHQSNFDFYSDEFEKKAKNTYDFAISTMKKIAEFCRYFSEQESLAFLDELNTFYIDKQEFYHPDALSSVYLDNCSNYDIDKADSGCYQRFSLIDLQSFSSHRMRKTFCFASITKTVQETVKETFEETETFDPQGHLLTRTRKRTIESGFFSTSSSKKVCPEHESNTQSRLDFR